MFLRTRGPSLPTPFLETVPHAVTQNSRRKYLLLHKMLVSSCQLCSNKETSFSDLGISGDVSGVEFFFLGKEFNENLLSFKSGSFLGYLRQLRVSKNREALIAKLPIRGAAFSDKYSVKNKSLLIVLPFINHFRPSNCASPPLSHAMCKQFGPHSSYMSTITNKKLRAIKCILVLILEIATKSPLKSHTHL